MIVFSVFVEPVLEFLPEFPRVVSVWSALAPAKFAAELECDRLLALGGEKLAGFVWHGDDADVWIGGCRWSAGLSNPETDVEACRIVVQAVEVDAPGPL